MKKKTYMEIARELAETSRLCLDVTGSYSNVTGAYEYILADILADLPLARQEDVLRSLVRTRAHIATLA